MVLIPAVLPGKQCFTPQLPWCAFIQRLQLSWCAFIQRLPTQTIADNQTRNLTASKYHEYVIVYVDDVLIISHSSQDHWQRTQSTYDLNPNSIGPPTQSLGSDDEQVTRPGGDPSGKEYWSFSTYVKHTVKNVILLLPEEGRGSTATTKAPSPSTTYPYEMDMSNKCNDDGSSRIPQLIGVVHWAVELGRIDIYTEETLLPPQSALPRVEHLEVVYHTYAYLYKHDKSSTNFDQTDPTPVPPTMSKPYWSSFYAELKEECTRESTELRLYARIMPVT